MYEEIRPILAGTVGGILAVIFCAAVAKWVPRACNGKSATVLADENRLGIIAANCLFIGSAFITICCYQYGVFDVEDWRPPALIIGGTFLFCMLLLPMLSLLKGNRPVEAIVAYSISQKLPLVCLYILIVAVVTLFSFALSSSLAGHYQT